MDTSQERGPAMLRMDMVGTNRGDTMMHTVSTLDGVPMKGKGAMQMNPSAFEASRNDSTRGHPSAFSKVFDILMVFSRISLLGQDWRFSHGMRCSHYRWGLQHDQIARRDCRLSQLLLHRPEQRRRWLVARQSRETGIRRL